jgi:hypothetical protein
VALSLISLVKDDIVTLELITVFRNFAIAYVVAQNYIMNFVFLLVVVATNQLVEHSVNEKEAPGSELPASQTLR